MSTLSFTVHAPPTVTVTSIDYAALAAQLTTEPVLYQITYAQTRNLHSHVRETRYGLRLQIRTPVKAQPDLIFLSVVADKAKGDES
ncbi:hypothetical protein UFOVP708_29 [uncultured Caudovirales phage]|uniref:Uncharacterized protein n=1 Tax=uncultured Caudovirales phage TaxID=2100421 RepID=A0A6J5NIU2_9CAUD|nr:hypothetical protein UFOVP708_29 [uncultured Caudovirales phage]